MKLHHETFSWDPTFETLNRYPTKFCLLGEANDAVAQFCESKGRDRIQAITSDRVHTTLRLTVWYWEEE